MWVSQLLQISALSVHHLNCYVLKSVLCFICCSDYCLCRSAYDFLRHYLNFILCLALIVFLLIKYCPIEYQYKYWSSEFYYFYLFKDISKSLKLVYLLQLKLCLTMLKSSRLQFNLMRTFSFLIICVLMPYEKL